MCWLTSFQETILKSPLHRVLPTDSQVQTSMSPRSFVILRPVPQPQAASWTQAIALSTGPTALEMTWEVAAC